MMPSFVGDEYDGWLLSNVLSNLAAGTPSLPYVPSKCNGIASIAQHLCVSMNRKNAQILHAILQRSFTSSNRKQCVLVVQQAIPYAYVPGPGVKAWSRFGRFIRGLSN